jgi:hypothetical protein
VDEVHEDFLAPGPEDPAGGPPDGREPVELVRVTVRDGIQVVHAGRAYPGGATLSAPAPVAAEWLANRWADPAATAEAPVETFRAEAPAPGAAAAPAGDLDAMPRAELVKLAVSLGLKGSGPDDQLRARIRRSGGVGAA